MSSDLKPSGSIPYRFIKRLFDVICAAVLMIPVGIVIGICAVFIKAEDQGSVFYSSFRTGRFGKVFKMYKLRTMKENAPDIRLSDGSTYSGDDDPRLTRFGKFARKISIDELPQIFNVLNGDMTFIGPRPDTPFGTAEYTSEEKIILTVRPGITGYNQVINRNSVLTKEKLKNDIYYINHLSLWFDIKIAFMTLATVFARRNINRADISTEATYILESDGTRLPTDIE